MVDPINLNKARKARAKAEASGKAAQNLIRFGRGKAERSASEIEAARAARALDQKKRED